MSAAVSPPEPIRTVAEDGTVHFNDLKAVAKSGLHYLHAVNTKTEPTRPMLIGTVVHFLVLGPRPGAKPIVKFDGDRRQGKKWDELEAKYKDGEVMTAELVTRPEWDEAEAIATAVRTDPVARARLEFARYEVPLRWKDGDLECSTSGIDIVSNGALCDLKTTSTTEPEAWKRHAFKFYYHCQMAFYRRGAIANGIDVSKGLYLLGVETKAPHAIVELELTEGLVDLADRTLNLWLERLRAFKESNQFPGYAQSPVPWDVPPWMLSDDEDEDGEEVIS